MDRTEIRTPTDTLTNRLNLKDDMPNTFHMPVYHGEMLETKTQDVLREAFSKLYIPDTDTYVRFIEFRFHVVGKTGERVIAEKYVNLHPDPSMRNTDFSLEGQAAYKEIVLAWVSDDLADQSVPAHPFPWDNPEVSNRMADRYLSLYWRPEFSILSQEYIPTYLEDNEFDPIGDNHDRSARTAMASLILPASDSAHAALQAQAGLSKSMHELEWIWNQMREDRDDIELKLDHPSKPIALE
jgi:hypothetical protein